MNDVLLAIAAWVALSFLVTGLYAFVMGRRREKTRQRQVLREAVAVLDADDIVDLVLRGGSEGKAA